MEMLAGSLGGTAPLDAEKTFKIELMKFFEILLL